MLGKPYGPRVHFFEIVATEQDLKETYAPLAWHRVYLGFRALWATTAALGPEPAVRLLQDMISAYGPNVKYLKSKTDSKLRNLERVTRLELAKLNYFRSPSGARCANNPCIQSAYMAVF